MSILKKLFGSAGEEKKEESIRALIRREQQTLSLPPLTEQKEESIRPFILRIHNKAGTASRKVVTDGLKDKSWEVRVCAVLELQRQAKVEGDFAWAVERLADAQQNDDKRVRAAATAGLAELKRYASLPPQERRAELNYRLPPALPETSMLDMETRHLQDNYTIMRMARIVEEWQLGKRNRS